MPPLRIGFLSRGHSLYDRRFLEKMVERGHKPHFISYWAGPRFRVEGVRNYFFDIQTMHRIRLLTTLQKVWHLRKLIDIIEPDVLHTGWVQDHGFLGALSGFHPTISMPWGSDILIHPERSRYLRWITRFTLNRADMITCDCEMVKRKIIEISGCLPDKIAVFPWGIDLGTFHPTDASQRRKGLGWHREKILIMTRNMISPVYGHEVFIEALPSIIRAEPGARVIFVGTGDLETKFRKRVAELGLIEFVHFAGSVAEKEMAEYLNAADLYVSTSLSDGTSCSLLEAMACGLPVVVSDLPSNLEWVEDGVNGCIVPRGDSAAIAKRIIHLLRESELRREMGQRNLEIAAERADWEKNFDEMERIYFKFA